MFGNELAIGFAGFHSKDAIIEGAWASGQIGASITGLIVALLTSFYSWRLMFLTFWGTPRWAGSEHIQHAAHGHGHGDDHAHHDAHDDHHDHAHHDDGTAGYHPHESPWPMLAPLVLLSGGAIAAGFVFHGAFIEPEAGKHFWRGAIAFSEHLAHETHEVPTALKLSTGIVMLLGLFSAWVVYIRQPGLADRIAGGAWLAHRWLMHKWYFDELYDVLFVKPAFAFGRLFWKRGDEGTIDRFGPNGAAAFVVQGSRAAAALQSGYIYTYAFVMLIGLTAVVTWAIAS